MIVKLFRIFILITVASSIWCTIAYGAKVRKINPPTLEIDASRALQKANGDMNIAQAILFEQKLEELKLEEPHIFASLIEQRKQQADENIILKEPSHSRLVELTWDVIGSFITIDKIDENIAEKCHAVADACVPAQMRGNCALLDVGCGDGSLLQFLRSVGVDESRYVGIDLSSTMISKAKYRLQYEKSKLKRKVITGRKEKEPTFIHGNYLTSFRCQPPSKFSTILFNGSFQFFSQTQWNPVLKQARSLLTVGSRLVISHIHGSEFVKAEKDGNKHLNISIMPSYNEISHICESVGFRPLPPTTNLEDFYLIILEAI